jgi:hypothetical protein
LFGLLFTLWAKSKRSFENGTNHNLCFWRVDSNGFYGYLFLLADQQNIPGCGVHFGNVVGQFVDGL